MDNLRPANGPRLTAYQEELMIRLTPLLDRLDPAEVTPDSGLQIAPAEASCGWTNTAGSWATSEGENLAVEVTVRRRDSRVFGWRLYASPTECLLWVDGAGGPSVEVHGNPGSVATLVSEIVDFVEAYLSGLTVVEEYDSRGRLIRTREISHRDSQPLAIFQHPEGCLSRIFGLHRRKVAEVRTLCDVRFLKEGGAAQQGDEADKARA
jgi:hypothetical protein